MLGKTSAHLLLRLWWPPATGQVLGTATTTSGWVIRMVTLHLAVLNQNKFRTTPPAHSPAGQRWGHLRGTPGRLPGTHTSMQGRADEQKHAKSVASGGRPERPPRPLARPHAGPAGRHRHPNHAPNAPDGGDVRGAAPAPANPSQARPTALPGPFDGPSTQASDAP